MSHVHHQRPHGLELAGYAGLVASLLVALNAASGALFGGQFFFSDPVANAVAAKLAVMLPALSVGLLSRARPGSLSRRAVVWLVSVPAVLVLLFQSVVEAVFRGSQPAQRVASVSMGDGTAVDAYRCGFYGAGRFVSFEITRSRAVGSGLVWGRTVGRTGYGKDEHVSRGPVRTWRDANGRLVLTFAIAGTEEHVTVR